MKNITLAIDNELLQKSRAYAHREGTSLNALVRKLLAEKVEAKGDRSFQDAWDLADKLELNLSGWKWNRDELYDRKVLR